MPFEHRTCLVKGAGVATALLLKDLTLKEINLYYIQVSFIYVDSIWLHIFDRDLEPSGAANIFDKELTIAKIAHTISGNQTFAYHGLYVPHLKFYVFANEANLGSVIVVYKRKEGK